MNRADNILGRFTIILQIELHGLWDTRIWLYYAINGMAFDGMDKQDARASTTIVLIYSQNANISPTLVSNKIIDHSDVVGAPPIGAAPTTSSF